MHRAKLDDNKELDQFARDLVRSPLWLTQTPCLFVAFVRSVCQEDVCIKTVESGKMTKDLALSVFGSK